MQDKSPELLKDIQPDDKSRWYLVQTLAKRELYAQEHLLRQGYQAFLPQNWRTTRHARKISTVRAAYFPGYLFVLLDPMVDQWRSIDSTYGVARIFKIDGRPAAAPRGLVETYIAMTGPDGMIVRSMDLEPGDSVRLIRGPFADHIARVDRLTGTERVSVLMEIMNQPIRVEVSRSDLAWSG